MRTYLSLLVVHFDCFVVNWFYAFSYYVVCFFLREISFSHFVEALHTRVFLLFARRRK